MAADPELHQLAIDIVNHLDEMRETDETGGDQIGHVHTTIWNFFYGYPNGRMRLVDADRVAPANAPGDAVPSALERELLDAAHFVDSFAKKAVASDVRAASVAFSARLRARASAVHQCEQNIAEVGIVGPRTEGAAELFRSLCGEIKEVTHGR